MSKLNDTKYIISQQESLQRAFKRFNDASLTAEEAIRGFISASKQLNAALPTARAASKRLEKFKTRGRNNAYCR